MPESPAATTTTETLLGKILNGPDDLDAIIRELDRLGADAGAAPSTTTASIPTRVNADPKNVEKGLAQLVLTLVDLLRRLMERQAVRRMDSGSLTEEEVERLGQTFLLLDQRMQELKRTFGLEDKDLNIDLGPLGKLI